MIWPIIFTIPHSSEGLLELAVWALHVWYAIALAGIIILLYYNNKRR